MSTIKLSSNSVSSTTIIPNIFIDNYMPRANGTYVKVYLYLLRCINCNDDMLVSISAIADKLDETEKDITRALCYWEKVRLISLVKNNGEQITSITINDINCQESNHSIEEIALATTPPVPVIQEEVVSQANEFDTNSDFNNNTDFNTNSEFNSNSEFRSATNTNLGNIFEKPTYSEAQIKQLTNTDEVKWLLNIIEIYLDRLIKPMDLQLILYLYESLGFSTELIMYLYEYCVSKNKKNPSYVEAVALSWAEEGIDTVEKAEASTAIYNSNYNAVNKAFGLNRSPGQVEKQYINKWLNKYLFSIDIIVEACNRTILATQKPDFKYADKILENWFKKGVKELSHVASLDEDHKRMAAQRANNKTNQPVAKASPNNRFNAFPQRNYTDDDYNSLEQKLLEKSKTIHR